MAVRTESIEVPISSIPLKHVRMAALSALLLGLAACSSSLVYNRLDTIARWYIGNLVTLDEGQQSALRDWLGRSLVWHRDHELQRYQEFLDGLAGRVAAGPDASVYREVVPQAEKFRHELAARLAPEAAQLLTTLRPQQVDELLANLEEHARDELDEERERTDLERRKRRTRSLTRNLERWTGSATADQKAIIEQTVKALGDAQLLGENDEWFASQKAWQTQLREALAEGAGAQPKVEKLLREPEKSYTAAYAQQQAAERQQFLDLVIALDATLTVKQRALLSRKLTELANDLQALEAAA